MNAAKLSRLVMEIEREYDFTRQEHARELAKRQREIEEKLPAYKELSENHRAAALGQLRKKLAQPGSFERQNGFFGGFNLYGLPQTQMSLEWPKMDTVPGWSDKQKETVGETAVATAEAEKPAQSTMTLKEQKRQLLVDNGYPADYLDPICTCKECEDTGFLRDKYGARRISCHCFYKKLSLLLGKDSGLYDLLETENFEHLSEEFYEGEDLESFRRARDAVMEFAQNGGRDYRNFFFYGNIGTGKSFLSCCAAKELLDQGKEVLYYSSAHLFDELAKQNKSGSSEEDVSPLMRTLYDCDLLILDDLGTEWFNSFVFSELFTLVNERIRRRKSTMISTNLTLKNLTEIYSERVLSRITSNYMLCKLTGPDIRMEKARRQQVAASA